MSSSDVEDEFVQPKPTLIMFHGPPCIGKTRYYKTFYEKSFARFSLEEWLDRNKEATLHSGIRRLSKKLQEGDSVVLDDCNASSKARSSIISALKKAEIEFVLEGVEFRPQGGLAMSQIGVEFSSAAEMEKVELERLNLTIDLESSDDEDEEESNESDEENKHENKKRGLERILDSETDLLASRRRRATVKDWEASASGLKYDEGFKLIQYIDQPFALEISEKARPALFLDAQSIMSFKWKDDSEFNFTVETVSGIGENVREWLENEPNGRVIVLIDDETFLPAVVSGHADSPETQALLIRMCHEQALDALQNLCLKVPLYYYHVHFGAFDPKDFQRTASLGPIAWLLRRHSLSLSSSLWVAPCPKNALHPVPWDIPYISATEFFSTGGWDIASKLRQFGMSNTSLPTGLRSPSISVISSSSLSSASIDGPYWPLEAERRSIIQESSSKVKDFIAVTEDISFGRTHGCIFPPLQSSKKRTSNIEADLLENLHGESLLSPTKRSCSATSEDIIEINESSSIPINTEHANSSSPSTVIEIDSQSP